ncbi:MAG: phosphate regulon sensor histidine kinase PhoR [Aestuariivirgaceae bacterium]
MIWLFTRDAAVPTPTDENTAASEPLALLAAVAHALPDPFLLLSRDGHVAIANRAAEDVFETQLTGKHISHTVRSPVILDAVQEVIAHREPLRVDFEQRIPLQRRFEASIAPVAKSDSSMPERPAIIILLRDLTHEQQLERMRADFVANASHELRTPLASLLGFIETLQGAAKNDSSARERFLGLMRTQAERMARLIDDLLSLSRIELNAHRRPTGIVDLESLIRQAAEMLQSSAAEAGVAINLAFSGDLHVPGDRDELIQVFQNLLENAIKYAAAGKRVDVTAGRDAAGRVEVAVADYGPGIAAEYLPRLTERFYRVSVQESRARGGTGLGLAIVKHILNRHRAKLFISSELGKGSTFTVRLPGGPEKRSKNQELGLS